ncbi:uncharacterized protein LOC115778038 [Archocentrus centrarchus]|uniref:uncharacterized protein LOC115778038 n=1 Tax=Archocentrus centrarchus TaxID=63155 RepID=UPI0011E9CBDA|nr:uncharacterized protein LOC115778038 [Archocentrus centrarchus]
MATTTAASLLRGVVCVCFLVCAAEVQKNIPAECGQKVTLPCRAPNISNIDVNWSRADLGEEYVLFHRDGRFDPDNQHPAFKKRVDLRDGRMTDGDVSLTVKDVTVNDTGTYECRVFMEETRSWKSICIISLTAHSSHLSVPEGPPGGLREGGGKEGGVSRGRAALIASVSLCAVLVVAAVALWIHRKHKEEQSQDPSHPPAEQQTV